MSMSLFFKAFAPHEVDAMEEDHSLVDRWVWEDRKFTLSMDIADAWDVLDQILSGAGFLSSRSMDDVLSNGCEVIAPELVKQHAASLSSWTHQGVLEGLQALDGDAYHLESYRDDGQDDLIDEFDKLAGFYRQAAEQGLAVIHYAA